MCGFPIEMRTGVDGRKAIFAHATSTPREVGADSIRALAEGQSWIDRVQLYEWCSRILGSPRRCQRCFQRRVPWLGPRLLAAGKPISGAAGPADILGFAGHAVWAKTWLYVRARCSRWRTGAASLVL
jgi:hypothetical protein